jgi:hypothetical protein
MGKQSVKDLSCLSKSQFIRGLQCPKSLYLYKTRPDLRDPVSQAQEAIFQSGTDVGIVAQGLFPGGKLVPYDGLSLDGQLKLTQAEIAAGAKVLYEPAFQFDQIFIKADILRKTGDEWDLYEVKGSIPAWAIPSSWGSRTLIRGGLWSINWFRTFPITPASWLTTPPSRRRFLGNSPTSYPNTGLSSKPSLATFGIWPFLFGTGIATTGR